MTVRQLVGRALLNLADWLEQLTTETDDEDERAEHCRASD